MASSALSESIWRISRPRDAPRASLTATSRSRGGASEHQIRQIRARDEQHQSGKAKQQPEGIGVIAAHVRKPVRRRLGGEFIPEIALHTFGVVLRRDGFVQRGPLDNRKLRRGALQRPSRFEPAKDRKPPLLALPRIRDAAQFAINNWLGADGNCNIEAFADGDAVEARRRNPKNGKRMPVHRERFADHADRATVAALPERIAQVRAARASGLVVAGRNQAPEHRLHIQSAKEITADPNHLRVIHFTAVSEVACILAPSGNGRKRLLPLANLLP
jgi:hypothetical protein